MINIPTELLRTLVAVAELRSFTKAAHALGVTQPAVSAQIKRLQSLLDCDLFDKSAPGVSLTPSGELLINYARRMLSINDQIVEMAVPRLGSQALRIGVPGDFAAVILPPILTRFRSRNPEVRFAVRNEHFDVMSRDLRQGELDLMVGVSEAGIMLDARHQWMESLAWVREPGFEIDPDAPVPLVTSGEVCALHRAAIATLSSAQRSFEVVFIGSSEASIRAAVKGRLGVSVVPRSRARAAGFDIWENPSLPPVGDVYCGIYLGETGDRRLLEELADAMFSDVGPRTTTPRAYAQALAAGTSARY